MNQILKIFFVGLLIGFSLTEGASQTTGKKKFVRPEPAETKTAPEEDSAQDAKSTPSKPAPAKAEKEPSRIGYGLNLGNIYFTNYSFQIGLDPNIAYKLDEALAVGFMLKMNYYYEKLPQYNLKYNGFDWGPTVFTRWKPLLKMNDATPFMQGIFLQLEYERAFISRPTDPFGNIDFEGDKIIPYKVKENYMYVGLGMASGYPFSSFISFHYNLIDDIELSRTPFTYRIGFTWNY